LLAGIPAGRNTPDHGDDTCWAEIAAGNSRIQPLSCAGVSLFGVRFLLVTSPEGQNADFLTMTTTGRHLPSSRKKIKKNHTAGDCTRPAGRPASHRRHQREEHDRKKTRKFFLCWMGEENAAQLNREENLKEIKTVISKRQIPVISFRR
jgi:hypothetical protein